MMQGVDEFTQEFAYLSGRDRWLAREAMGFGTLRGLALRLEKDRNGMLLPSVTVTSGVGLTPSGQLVCVDRNQCIDINRWLAARDQELTDRFGAGVQNCNFRLYVTLAYCDCRSDDVPVPGEPDCNADDLLQPSRIIDCFQLDLTYEPPLQEEEDAVRGFSAWLRQVVIDPTPNNSVTPVKFVAAVRAWNTSASDPASLTISAADVPDYFATALRLWVTELRGAAAAFQRFKLWLYSAPHSIAGTATKNAFLTQVRRWTPEMCSWPGNLIIKTSDGIEFIEDALALWDMEIAPKWYSEFCGCGAQAGADIIEDRLLLGAINFSMVKNAGNSWMVDFTGDTTSVDESRRPVLGHLRMQQEQLIPGSTGVISVAPVNTVSSRIVALGRLSAGRPQLTPVVGNAKITSIMDGEVRFTFDGYSMPDSDHDYVIHVMASFTGNKSEPAVSFVEFDPIGFLYKVTRSNKGVLRAELERMEFQVEVFIIVKPD